MSAVAKLGVFSATLAAVFAGALAVGAVVGPIDTAGDADHSMAPTDSAEAAALPRGLTVTQDGYRFVPDRTVVAPETAAEFTFRIVDAAGTVALEFDELHERPLHLIVVSRNLVDYAHLHPQMRHDGRWTVELPALRPGSYRMFADFQPAGSTNLTLGADLVVPGELVAGDLAPVADVSTVDGYEVTLAGEPVVGDTDLMFTVRLDGEVVPTDPYLGAAGHLVALRAADLAYLHVHPHDETEPEVAFTADFPSAGTYRLFLDFSHGGAVHTAAFTVVVPDGAPTEPSSTSPHDEGH